MHFIFIAPVISTPTLEEVDMVHLPPSVGGDVTVYDDTVLVKGDSQQQEAASGNVPEAGYRPMSGM